MKICIVCSQGGHLTEMLLLLEAFNGHEIFFVTYEGLNHPLEKKYLLKEVDLNPLIMLYNLPVILNILYHERPQLMVSTGAEIAIPFFYLAKILGINTIYIESWSRVNTPSATARLIYPVADIFLVQWEGLLKEFGKKASFKGRVL